MNSRVITKNFTFGAFQLDIAHRLLTHDGGPVVPLTPKAFELLLVLVESEGRLLTKAELMNRMWPDSFVEEGNLTQTISVLRKALGENLRQHHYIVTVPGQGYRFVADVHETEESPPEGVEKEISVAPANFLHFVTDSPQTATPRLPPARGPLNRSLMLAAAASLFVIVLLVWGVSRFTSPAESPKSVTEVKSIAVLPFKNIGSPADEEYLGPGLAEVLITKLSHIKTIVVRPTSAVLKYADATPDPQKFGSALNVEAVLLGSVQKVGENIRVTAQLVRVSDGATLWAETFDDKFTNIFAVQDSLSAQVARTLSVKLTAGEQEQLTKRYTANTEAFQLYLQGRYFWNKRTPENLSKAIEQFEKAKQLDSGFALAYIGLADCYVLLAEYRVMPPREAFPKAREAAAKALEIDNQLAEVRTSLAYILAFYEWDFPAAEREFKKALEQNPNNATTHQWYAEYLQVVGRFDESWAELLRAEELDPLSLIIKTDVARYYYFTRQYDKAIEQSHKILALDPNFGWGYSFLWISYKEKGLLPEAVDAHIKAEVLFGRSAIEMAARRKAFAQAGWKGYWRKWLEQSETPAVRPFIQAIDKAAVYQEIGDQEQVFAALQQSFEKREHWLLYIKTAPQFDSLRSDPRFQDLLRRIGL